MYAAVDGQLLLGNVKVEVHRSMAECSLTGDNCVRYGRSGTQPPPPPRLCAPLGSITLHHPDQQGDVIPPPGVHLPPRGGKRVNWRREIEYSGVGLCG